MSASPRGSVSAADRLLSESRFRATEAIRFIKRGQPYEAEQWARLAATAAVDYLMLCASEQRIKGNTKMPVH